MSNHLYSYTLYDRTLRKLLLFTGLWPKANPSIPYRLLPLLHGVAALVMGLALLNFSRHNFADLNLVLKGLSIALSYATVIQKTICFTCYRKRLVELHATLAITFGQDLEDTKLQPILLSPLPSFYKPSLTLSTVTYLTVIAHWIAPIIAIVVQLLRGVDRIKYILPFPAIYPWGIHVDGWLYLVHYAFEIYAGICLVSFTSSTDSLFGYYIFQISGQLRTLSHRLCTVKSKDDYRKVIRECVTRHQTLTRCQRHLEQIYGPIVLWMLVTSAMIICALIYQGSQMRPGKAGIVGIYIVMKSGQALVYGWFGSFLTTESDAFREAIYASDWPGSGEKSFMTDVLIMITYKPMDLTACSLSTITVDMFVAYMRATAHIAIPLAPVLQRINNRTSNNRYETELTT